ncbi:MAG: GNAT family N-acetyltransferase [Planctomycetota bacterium]
MTADGIRYSETREIDLDQIVRLYHENAWSSARKPVQLRDALIHSHTLISAWEAEALVGIGNAISDGHLVVYYPHLIVRPSYQRMGIGREILERLSAKYSGFHQQMLVADLQAVDFYQRNGFRRAGETVAMWIYDGEDHSRESE